MDFMDFIKIIESIGFPILACIAIAKYLDNKDKLDREERKLDKENDRDREDKLLEANTELLITNRQLAEHVEVLTKDIRNDISRTESKVDKILEKVGN